MRLPSTRCAGLILVACSTTACLPVVNPTPEPPVPATNSPPSTAPRDPAPFVVQPGAPTVRGCRMFPDTSVFNTRVDRAPVSPHSSAMLERFESQNPGEVLTTTRARIWQGSRPGIPLNFGGVSRRLALDGSYGQPSKAFTAVLPLKPRIEGEPGAAWDRHVLVLHPETCRLDEHINYRYDLFRGWLTGGSVSWDLSSNSTHSTPFVPGGAHAEAAALPMANLIYRYDEVAAGEIRHAIRFTAPVIGSGHVWPARRSDGIDKHPDALPMGARLRLRAAVSLSGLGPQARVVATAMRRYGIILADTGGRWAVGGEGDERWNDSDLAGLSRFRPSDFEVVDLGTWMVRPDSFEARP